jgi:hypothetical protein
MMRRFKGKDLRAIFDSIDTNHSQGIDQVEMKVCVYRRMRPRERVREGRRAREEEGGMEGEGGEERERERGERDRREKGVCL